MASDGIVSRALRRRPVEALIGATLAMSLAVGGCSSVPDAVNPVEWYKSTTNLFSGNDKEKQDESGTKKEQNALVADRGKEPPGADKAPPNLASVPERPQVSSAEERRRVAEGLVSDPDRPRYSSEAVQLQGAPTEVLRSPPPQPPAPAAPTPSTAAAAPVTGAPVSLPPIQQAAASPPSPAPATQTAELPPTVAAAPPPPPPAPRGVEETYRARLAERLPAPPKSTQTPPAPSAPPAAATAPALPPTPTPANAEVPGVGGPFETVVISGGGVQMGNAPPAPITAGPAPMKTVTAEPLLPTPSASSAPAAGGSIKVATILFDMGSARLHPSDRKILRQVRDLQRERGGTMRVVGHASSRTRNMDPIKHKMVNYKISLDRAESVARELIRLGVDRKAIRIDAESDSVPVYYEIMPSGEAGNRRADIYLDY